MPAERLIVPDVARLGEAAADRLLTALQASEGPFALALSGGHTPRYLDRALVARNDAIIPHARRFLIFWGDERLVPLDHPESNFRLAQAEWLRPAGLQAARVFPPPVEAPSPEEAAIRYERTLLAVLGPRPVFDLNILGLGADGHTASLFPHTPELEEEQRWVVATSAPHAGMYRISFTLPLINAARRILFLVSGKEKQAALARVWAGDTTLPAARVRPHTGEPVWIVDQEAAGR